MVALTLVSKPGVAGSPPGVALGTAANGQVDQIIASDAAGPAIVRVRDVIDDPGGRLVVEWDSSSLDAGPAFGIQSYSIWRQVPRAPAPAPALSGAVGPLESEPPLEMSFRFTINQGRPFTWEYLAKQPAGGFPGYSDVAATTSDWITASNPDTWLEVEAAAQGSAPDSGYSVDNLAPAAPAAFTAQYFLPTGPLPARGALAAAKTSPAFTWLHWAPSDEADFLEYRLYRGPSADFVPGPTNLVVAKRDTGYKDIGAPPSHYKLVTVDGHGNVSLASATVAANITLVPEFPEAVLSFAPPMPNPMRDGVMLQLSLSAAGPAQLAVYDAGGRSIRVLFKGSWTAGAHAVSWDGRDLAGHTAPPGLYFVRFEALGRSLVQRVSRL